MKANLQRKFLLLVFGLSAIVAIQAQDIHFSQYYNSPLNIGPAMTGIFNGDYRFIGNYRNQWSSVPVAYKTFSGSFDMRYQHKIVENGFFGGGIVFNSDKAGDAELSLSTVAIRVSYAQVVSVGNGLSIGFQMGVGQRAFKTEGLRLGNQFVDVFMASAPTGENFNNTSVAYTDMSTGFNWHFQPDGGKSFADFGFGIFHLNRPKQDFFSSASDIRLPMRFSVYGMGEIAANENLSYLIHAIGQGQGPYNEAVIGGGVKYWLSHQRGKEIAVQFGTAYRFIGPADAVIPSFELHYLAWKAGFSYDINLSDFARATGNRGGPELSIEYIFRKVRPKKALKACPIF